MAMAVIGPTGMIEDRIEANPVERYAILNGGLSF